MDAPCASVAPWSGQGLDVDPSDRKSLGGFFGALSNIGRRDLKRDALRYLLDVSPHRALIQFQLAFMAQEEQQWDEAARALEDAVSLEPTFTDAHVHLAHVHEQRGCWEDAARAHGRVHERYVEMAQARYPLADVSGETGSTQSTTAESQKWLRDQPTFRAATLGLGLTLARLGRGEAAAMWLRRAVELGPEDPELVRHVVVTLSNVDRETRRGALRGLLPVTAHRALVLFHLGFVAQEEQRWDEAARVLEEAVALDPTFIEARAHLAYVYAQQERWAWAAQAYGRVHQLYLQEARTRHPASGVDGQVATQQETDACQAWLREQPQCRAAMLGLGSALIRLERWEAAVVWLRRAVHSHPDDAELLRQVVTALSTIRERRIRHDALSDLLTVTRHRATVLFHVAFMAQEEQRWDEAARALEEAVALDPMFIEARAHLAYVYAQQERWEWAAQAYGRVHQLYLQEARTRHPASDIDGQAAQQQETEATQEWLRGQPQCRSAMLGLGSALIRLERWEAAVVWLCRAVQLHPDDAELLRQVVTTLSTIRERRIRHDALSDLLAVTRHPATVLFHVAFMAQEEQRWDEAARALEEAVAIEPHLIDAHAHLAHVYEQQSRWEQAVHVHGRVYDLYLRHASEGHPLVDTDGEWSPRCDHPEPDGWLSRQARFRTAIIGLGTAFGRLKDDQAAALWLGRALRLDPQDADLVRQATAVLSSVGDRSIRQHTLHAWLEWTPHRAPLLLHLAYMDQEDGRWHDAAARLRAVLSDAPGNGDALSHLAHVSERLQRWDDVVMYRGLLIDQSPHDSDAWCGRGRALEALGRYGEAEENYTVATQLQPDRTDAWTGLWSTRGKAGDLDGAVEACLEARALRPDDRDHQLQLMAALHSRGDATEALTLCRELRRADCEDVPWSRFMEVLASFVRAPATVLPADTAKTWDYFHYNRPKVLATLEAALTIREQFPHAPRVFVGQGLIAWEKTMGFLSDERFRRCLDRYDHLRMMANWEWNLHVIQWAATQALRVDGDFVELGVYRGYTTAVTAENIDFATANKRWYLYDTFAGIPADQRTDGWPHAYEGRDGDTWFAEVVRLFDTYPNIDVIRGRVPEVFESTCPTRIAFLHIDLNSARAEVGALDALFERLSPGAVVVFDDYGWYTAREQFDAENQWMSARGLGILELPTGQGLFIKPAASPVRRDAARRQG